LLGPATLPSDRTRSLFERAFLPQSWCQDGADGEKLNYQLPRHHRQRVPEAPREIVARAPASAAAAHEPRLADRPDRQAREPGLLPLILKPFRGRKLVIVDLPARMPVVEDRSAGAGRV
jgi:hypothetical protein